jgi:hypothetical protein
VVMLFAPNQPTNSRLPLKLFLLWMLLPTVFPILFLTGIFSSNEALIGLQTSPWRAAVEYLLFGLGVTLLYVELRQSRGRLLSQGALTIVLLAFLFMAKSLLTNAYYLADRCPKSTLNYQMAWLSNSAEEVRAYKKQTGSENFYHSPFGQFVCTRTQEELFH